MTNSEHSEHAAEECKVRPPQPLLIGLIFSTALCFLVLVHPGHAQDETETETPEAVVEPKGFPAPEGLTRLSPDHPIWLDTKRKMVVVDGEVCLREGQLEMFACPRQTKEHESVVTIDSPARLVHAGLLAIGARSGKPVQFDPEYKPASGDVIEIMLLWQDEDGKRQKARAQEWVRDVRTKMPLKYEWVFAGSGFWKDPDTGEAFYHGDAGDFICVSNFPSATMDLPVESTQANAELLFEAFSERIPPRGTPIRLVLKPRKPTHGEKAESSKPRERGDSGEKSDEPSDRPSGAE